MPKLLEAFGGTGRNADAPTARTLILCDVLRVKSKWNCDVDNALGTDSLVKLDNGTMVRVVKFKLPGGKMETLITDLFELPEECFPKLYFLFV
ncbi:MAG: hypothetical protein LBC93_03030 [Synergistaceae bacterium]|jgi:hypothetical protein|nr:hypothetical protein [Synergistaceae bacterium]